MLAGIVAQMGENLSLDAQLIAAVHIFWLSLTVAMVCYTLLAVEFLYRVYFNTPFQRKVKVSPPGTPSSDKSWKLENNEVFLPPRLSLMVLGLAVATLFVFIRFVTSIGRRHPSFSHW